MPSRLHRPGSNRLFSRVLERAHEQEEIRLVLGPEGVFASLLHRAPFAASEEIARLSQRGEQGDGPHAIPLAAASSIRP